MDTALNVCLDSSGLSENPFKQDHVFCSCSITAKMCFAFTLSNGNRSFKKNISKLKTNRTDV